MQIRHLLVLVLISLTLGLSNTFAQDNGKWMRINKAWSGLPSDQVRDIIFSPDGQTVWVATDAGLAKWDKIYLDDYSQWIYGWTTYSTFTSFISSNDVHHLIWESDSTLLVACGSNIDRLYVKTGLFTQIATGFIVHDWDKTSNGTIWIAAWNNLVKLFGSIPVEINLSILGFSQVKKLSIDNQDRIWFCNEFNGVGCYNEATGKIAKTDGTTEYVLEYHLLIGQSCYDVEYDNIRKKVWIINWSGLINKFAYFDLRSNQLFNEGSCPQPGVNQPLGIHVDSMGRIWITEGISVLIWNGTNQAAELVSLNQQDLFNLTVRPSNEHENWFSSGNYPGRGIKIFTYADTVVVTDVDQIPIDQLPVDYVLSQNYPNPFNPTTSIEYELPQPAHVRLVIYNTQGQLVETLINEQLPAGKYSVTWDGGNLPSGAYIYQLQTDAYTKTKKMLLSR